LKPTEVQAWLDRYVRAWGSYDRDEIKSLFSSRALYSYHPWEQPLRGANAIADSWLGEQDAPGSWKANYRPAMINGNRGTATGTTTYSDGRVFWNLWELEFDDAGRCSRFVEWFMLQPPEP
jgi:hypothetical protein